MDHINFKTTILFSIFTVLPIRMMKDGNRKSGSQGDSESGSDRESDESVEERPKLSKRKRDVSVLDSDDE